MYLLVDGDYFLSGFVPSSEEEVKRAVERLLTAIEEQLLCPAKNNGYAILIDFRLISFSSALLDGLASDARSCVISSLRRLRFQTIVLESIRGRQGTPVDAALCTKILQLCLLPTVGAAGGDVAAKHSFCLVTHNAYLATALDLLVSRECGEVTFAVYDGDEVAEALLGYASARYGASGGVATMPRAERGVTFVPDTASAIMALAQVQQQQRGRLPLSTLTELKALQTKLQQENEQSHTGATVAMSSGSKTSDGPTAMTTDCPPSTVDAPAVPGAEDLFGSQKVPPHQPTAPQPSSFTSSDKVESNSSDADDNEVGGGAVKPPSEVPSTSMPLDRVNVPLAPPQQQQLPVPAVPSFFATGPPRVVTTATSPAAVVRLATAPSTLPPPPLVATVAAAAAVAGEPEVSTLLPSEWAVLYDPVRQRHFFAYTDSNGRSHSTWQHPLGPDRQRELEEQVQEWRLARVASTRLQPQQQVQQVPPSQQQQPLAGAALPEGWEQRVDHRTGRTFYVNHITRTTTWTLPTMAPSQPSVSSLASSANSILTPSVRPDASQDEWESRIDPASGRTFYVNHRTKQTSWTLPMPATMTAPAPMTPPIPAQPPLPPNWEARVDPGSGRTYYVNHALKTTTWERPAH